MLEAAALTVHLGRPLTCTQKATKQPPATVDFKKEKGCSIQKGTRNIPAYRTGLQNCNKWGWEPHP
jgi:hypothetical protein